MSDEALDYKSHLGRYEKFFGGIPEHDRDFVIRQILHTHAWSVFSPLRDLQIRALALADRLTNDRACYYMRYGAGRRLSMIWNGYRSIISIASPKREESLSADQTALVTRDINLIYIQLRGVLDNLAWCFAHEKEQELLSLNPFDIGLFSAKMRKMSKCSSFWDRVALHDDWAENVKERRDPVAHRIPLYLPPSVITKKEDRLHYIELREEAIRAIKNGDFDRASALSAYMNNIGKFVPCITHDPDERTLPLYPTLPEDMVSLIRLYNIVEDELDKEHVLAQH